MSLQKRKPIRSKAITQAANGEPCTLCGRNDGTTVFCHLNNGWAGKGIGQKSDDIAGFFGCGKCHRLYDTHEHEPNDAQVLMAFYKTIRRLYDLGIIQIKGSK